MSYYNKSWMWIRYTYLPAKVLFFHAESFDLATCWNGLIQGAASGDHLKGFTKLAEFLRIPGENKCYAAMTIGYPFVFLHSIPERKVDVTWING